MQNNGNFFLVFVCLVSCVDFMVMLSPPHQLLTTSYSPIFLDSPGLYKLFEYLETFLLLTSYSLNLMFVNAAGYGSKQGGLGYPL